MLLQTCEPHVEIYGPQVIPLTERFDRLFLDPRENMMSIVQTPDQFQGSQKEDWKC